MSDLAKFSLGPMLMVEMSRRGGFTESLLRDAGQQASYCLDATEDIPSGAVEWYVDPDFKHVRGPLVCTICREMETGKVS